MLSVDHEKITCPENRGYISSKGQTERRRTSERKRNIHVFVVDLNWFRVKKSTNIEYWIWHVRNLSEFITDHSQLFLRFCVKCIRKCACEYQKVQFQCFVYAVTASDGRLVMCKPRRKRKIQQNAIDEPTEFKHVHFEFRYILYLRKAWSTYVRHTVCCTHMVDGICCCHKIKKN